MNQPVTMTKTELKQRMRYVRGGMWNDVIMELIDGTSCYVRRSHITPDNRLQILVRLTQGGETYRIIGLDHVTRVHR